jgi:predicted ATPase with chaperone activity
MTMTMVAPERAVAHPAAPTTLEEAGLSLDLLLQLTLKTLHFAGELTGSALVDRLGVKFGVVEPALDQLKHQRHIEIVGGTYVGSTSYRYRITDAGRERVALFLAHNQYVGVAPVPLEQYVAYMREFARWAPTRHVSREQVSRAFAHLVLKERMIDQLGPAINAGRSLFIYGPAGNGKTVISQAIRGLLEGEIAIPHALEVEGQIVRVFDPVNHDAIPDGTPGQGLDGGASPDRRWVRCNRPLVMAGGELTLEQLALVYNPSSGYYRAPLQVVANGGVFVVDDFGRQQVPPESLLNRWIVPLESRVDFLTLHTGQTFVLPFEVLVVFATNLRPSQLVDEAFLRRIHAKVLAEPPSRAEFHQIFRDRCGALELPCDSTLVDQMLDGYYRPRKIPLRGCHPRDLVAHALSLADYRGEPRRLTLDLLVAACDTYFVNDQEPVTETA